MGRQEKGKRPKGSEEGVAELEGRETRNTKREGEVGVGSGKLSGADSESELEERETRNPIARNTRREEEEEEGSEGEREKGERTRGAL